MNKYLSFDIGGSSMKYAVINDEAVILDKGSKKTPKTLEEMYQVIVDVFKKYNEIEGLALSMPGAVDSDTGIIGGASAVPYIHGPHIKEELERRLNVRVEMENDANCAALAEVWKGAGCDVDDCCFIVSGSGIGGAIVKDKRIHKGKHLHGGEYGYMIADFDYDTKQMKIWSDTSTVEVVNRVAKVKNVDVNTLDGKDIFDHYRDDPDYFTAVDKFYYSLAIGIYNLQYAYDPEKIIIGGGISIRDDLVDEINQRLDVIFETIQIAEVRPVVLTCHYHNDANLIGAIYHYLTKNS